MHLYVVGQLFDRGRLRRIGQAIRRAPTPAAAVGLVADELDELLTDVTGPADREALYRRIAETVRSKPPRPNPVTKADLMGAFVSFWLVFLASIPAAIPFLRPRRCTPRAARVECNPGGVAIHFRLLVGALYARASLDRGIQFPARWNRAGGGSDRSRRLTRPGAVVSQGN